MERRRQHHALDGHRHGRVRRSLLRFNLAGVPASAEIAPATLSLYQTYKIESSTVHVHRATAAWTESGVTWGNAAAAISDPAIEASFVTGGPSGTTGFRNVDVTALAQAWVSGELANHGVLIEEGRGDPEHPAEQREREHHGAAGAHGSATTTPARTASRTAPSPAWTAGARAARRAPLGSVLWSRRFVNGWYESMRPRAVAVDGADNVIFGGYALWPDRLRRARRAAPRGAAGHQVPREAQPRREPRVEQAPASAATPS